jgi:hypothetical protein
MSEERLLHALELLTYGLRDFCASAMLNSDNIRAKKAFRTQYCPAGAGLMMLFSMQRWSWLQLSMLKPQCIGGDRLASQFIDIRRRFYSLFSLNEINLTMGAGWRRFSEQVRSRNTQSVCVPRGQR